MKIGKRLFILVFPLLILFVATDLRAQTELKFNAASALILIPNVGIEVPITEHFSFQLDLSGSFWDSFDGKPLQFTQAFGEVRYYGKNDTSGFFFGGHVGFGMFTLTKYGYDEDVYQSGRNYYIGASIGYKKRLSDRWALELFVGGGTSQATYRAYSQETRMRIDIPLDEDRNFNKSGEWIPYRGGLMLVYSLL
jgi:hypothetical protein